MKAVILAGGLGTRLAEETGTKPKPMVQIGGMPLLWHLMKHYSTFGINDFVVCCGYKGHIIKQFFCDYANNTSDITVDLQRNSVTAHTTCAESWKVTLVDTGKDTMTGGRLKRIQKYIASEDQFCMTYGDGLSDVDVAEVIKFHKSHRKLATITTTRSPDRFGILTTIDAQVMDFSEKPKGEINGGFFVLSPKVLDETITDQTIWEKEPLQNLARSGELMAYKHDGFWQPMDTLADKVRLEEMWQTNNAPWRTWID